MPTTALNNKNEREGISKVDQFNHGRTDLNKAPPFNGLLACIRKAPY